MSKFKISRNQCLSFGIIVAVSASAIIGIRLLGLLQPLELLAFDLLFKIRPVPPTDERILIVGAQESDIQKYGWSVSDRILAELITRIRASRPVAIGLDIYRDVPVPPGRAQLMQVYRSTRNLVGVQKAIGSSISPKIAPPPILRDAQQVAATDVVVDGDGVLRRGMLFPLAAEEPALPGLGLAVSLFYLNKFGIKSEFSANGWLKLGTTVFYPLEENDGGYVRTDAGSYQILLNWLYPPRSYSTVSFNDILENKVPSEKIRDRIVLIGTYTSSIRDEFYTPYSRQLTGSSPIPVYGVEVHANIASQILSSVLDGYPLIRVWQDAYEYFAIGLCVCVGVSLSKFFRYRNSNSWSEYIFTNIFYLIATCLILIISSYVAFLDGWWLPVVPCILGLLIANVSSVSFTLITSFKKQDMLLTQVNQELLDAVLALKESKQELLEYANSVETQFFLLEEYDEKIYYLLKTESVALWEWNLQANSITIYNPQSVIFEQKVEKKIEVDYEEIVNRIHPEDRSRFLQLHNQAIYTEAEFVAKLRLNSINQSFSWYRIQGKPRYNKEEETKYILGIIEYISIEDYK